MFARNHLIMLLGIGSMVSTGAACGSDDPAGPGYTRCGSVMCAPGQYCDDARFSSCATGCLSNENCRSDQVCDTADAFPYCQNVGAPPPPPPPPADGGPPPMGDVLAECQAACDHFQSCGLGAGEAAGCRTDCAMLTPDQQRAVANCRDVGCVRVPECLGVDCLNDRDCDLGETCLDFTCL